MLVGWNFFDVLGVRPVLGRSFLPEDDQPGGRPVVLISDSLVEAPVRSRPAS